jgi:hypothetical protein
MAKWSRMTSRVNWWLLFFRVVGIFIVVSVCGALVIGIPQDCTIRDGVASCGVTNLRAWWDGGSRVSYGAVHANLYTYAHPKGVNRLADVLIELMVAPGVKIWNFFATNTVTRILLGLVTVSAIYDLLKAGVLALFKGTIIKPAENPNPTPETAPAGDPSGSV